MLKVRTQDPGPAAPRSAEGVDLIGEYEGSGIEETTYLARRVDGQFIHLSRLLYLVAEATNGRRDFGQIAEQVSEGFGRRLTADNVRFLVEEKLRPLGVLAPAEGEEHIEPRRLEESVLGLRFRLGLVPADDVRFITAPFLSLFWPPVVVAVLVALVAFDVWLFFHGILPAAQAVIYQPSLLLAFFALEMVAMAWHECGHVTACRYGGAKPGEVGAGIYLFWFVFYSDVTDSYRLDKVGRLRTDFGGIYFDAVFTLLLAGAYFLTGFEPLLVMILFNQLGVLDEFSPFLRFDGYYIISDLTGVPDLFKSIKPTLRGLIPSREADEQVRALKPWVRVVVTVWVLSVVPILLFGLAMLVIYGPWAIATAWDSFLVHQREVSIAFEYGRTIDVLLGLLNVVALMVPVVGGILIFAVLVKRCGAAARRWSEGRLLLRAGLGLTLAVAVGLLLLIWVKTDFAEILPSLYERFSWTLA
jgi:putative peptide zinc metalloprotease protein